MPADQPEVRVFIDDPTAPHHVALNILFQAVPIPANALPAGGTDHQLVIWQPDTDRMWEFWNMRKVGSDWWCSFGGGLQNVSTDPGYYTTSCWPGLSNYNSSSGYNWGGAATSLPYIGGAIRLEELALGEIKHALAFTHPAPRQTWFTWPAQRCDGNWDSPNAIPEGARFRLPASFDCDTIPHTLPRMMAKAIQEYGMVLQDRSGSTVGFYFENYEQYYPYPGPNPFWDTATWDPLPNGYLQGHWPFTLCADIPWAQLELLPMNLDNYGPTPPPAGW